MNNTAGIENAEPALKLIAVSEFANRYSPFKPNQYNTLPHLSYVSNTDLNNWQTWTPR